MIIDFSKDITLHNIPNILPSPSNEWESKIINFITQWYTPNPLIKVRTSGSTGFPKEIIVKKEALLKSAEMTGVFLKFRELDQALLCLPVDFIAGKMMIVRAIRWKMILECLPPTLNITLESHKKYNFSAMTPMQVNHSMSSLENIEKLIVGGAKLNNNLIEELKNLKTTIYETYGMTETLSHIALKDIKTNNAFETLPHIEIDVDNRECLIIKTPFIDEKIVTNDLVQLTSKHSFIWLGRVDNVINTGGIKIIPEVVEEKLKPYIQENFIIAGIPDELLGQKVILIVEKSSNNFINLNNLADIPTLSKFETPKEIFYTKQFETTESNKPIRHQIVKTILK